MIQCPHAITFTPEGGSAIVLVEMGGWIEFAPTFEASQGMYESDGILLSYGFFRPLGNVVVEFTITPEADHEDLAEALESFLADGELPDVAGVLSIGGWQFEDAVMTVENPDLPSGPTSTTIRAFQFKASLPVPPP